MSPPRKFNWREAYVLKKGLGLSNAKLARRYDVTEGVMHRAMRLERKAFLKEQFEQRQKTQMEER